jgi:hypothetical protein
MCMYTCIHKHTCINSLKFKCHAYPGWNIGPHKALIHKVYNNKLRQRNIEDKECAHHDAHFQKELDSIRLAWLALLAYSSRRRNTSSEGSSNQAVIFTQTQTTVQPEKRMSEQTQKPLCNTAFL